MNNKEIFAAFDPLWEPDLGEKGFEHVKPLLAHYTSIAVVESVLTTNELWFSNPLLMNDLEEVQFSVETGRRLVLGNRVIADACNTPARATLFDRQYAAWYDRLARDHIFNTYVMCFSEHKPDDEDGLLSMWRGYGGNGTGAAVVFDTGKLDPIDASALILAKVKYGTQQQREDWIKKLIDRFAGLLARANIPDDGLWLAAHALFERIKVMALFSKHGGFSEEKEWRVAYDPNRDPEKRMAPMFSYVTGPRGIEPKLKFKVGPIDGFTGKDLSLDGLIERILLGPSVASPLAVAAFNTMLDRLNRSALKGKVRFSRIPFRALR